jgi:GT2 family glycosyltransferase
MQNSIGDLLSVAIQIVNWNGGNYLEQCLDSVYAQDYRGPIEVTVIDNASSDNSLAVLPGKFPQVKIIRNPENLGFCRAHNQGIRSSKSDLVMVLNFDIVLQPDFLRRMVEAIKLDRQIGMISGKLFKLLEGRPSKILDTTGIRMRQYFSMPRGELENDHEQYDGMECRKIFGPCGAAPLYRREMLEDIRFKDEYFDEDFVNYVEDVDLAWRARLRGWDAVYVPEAVAYHERGATRKSNVQEQKGYLVRGYRNRYLSMYKNMTQAELHKRRFTLILNEAAFIFFAGKNAGSLGIRWRAFREACALFGHFQSKRAFVQSCLHSPGNQTIHFLEYTQFGFIHSCLGRIFGYTAILRRCCGFILRFFRLEKIFLRCLNLVKGKTLSS